MHHPGDRVLRKMRTRMKEKSGSSRIVCTANFQANYKLDEYLVLASSTVIFGYDE